MPPALSMETKKMKLDDEQKYMLIKIAAIILLLINTVMLIKTAVKADEINEKHQAIITILDDEYSDDDETESPSAVEEAPPAIDLGIPENLESHSEKVEMIVMENDAKATAAAQPTIYDLVQNQKILMVMSIYVACLLLWSVTRR